jgi:hypothetical protein
MEKKYTGNLFSGRFDREKVIGFQKNSNFLSTAIAERNSNFVHRSDQEYLNDLPVQTHAAQL